MLICSYMDAADNGQVNGSIVEVVITAAVKRRKSF